MMSVTGFDLFFFPGYKIPGKDMKKFLKIPIWRLISLVLNKELKRRDLFPKTGGTRIKQHSLQGVITNE